MTKKGALTKAVFDLLETGSLLTAEIVVGALTRGQNRYGRSLYNRRYYLRSTLSRLIQKKLIKFQRSSRGQSYLRLTKAGQQRLVRYQLEELRPKKPKHWDNKWRVIIFDIKELRRGDRDLLRNELELFGFRRLQNSVWVFPYDCEELVFLLKTSLCFGRDLLYLVVERIENDHWLRTLFGLV